MYKKDFNQWNKEKQYLDSTNKSRYFAEREIWWCAMGVNIGVEIDGKNGKFERPVIVVKYINKDIVFVIPLTTKGFSDKNHIEIKTDKMNSFAKITQIRVISCKRLLRKIDTLEENQFRSLKQALLDFLA